MPDIVVCILLALLATSLDNLGLGLQKAGSDWMPGGLRGLRQARNAGLMAVWVGGILMCIAAPFTLGGALSHGPASVVSALGAFGLIPLYLFAGLVLREPITRSHGAALVLITVGVAWIGWQTSRHGDTVETLHARGLVLAAGASVLVPGVLAALAAWRGSRQLGLFLGCLSGALGGLNLLILKVGAVLHSWWTSGGGWILVSILAFLVLQVAWRHGTAVQIVPSNTATAILVPVAAAPFAFGEPITTHLVAGMVAILLGIAALAHGERLAAELAPAVPAQPAPGG